MEWRSGIPLPSEESLATTLGVARSTVREALRGLEHEGIITRRQGIGNFVSAHANRISGNLTALELFVETIQSAGFEAQLKTVAVQLVAVTDFIRGALETPADAETWRIDNLYLADGKPAILTRSFIPTTVVPKTYDLPKYFRDVMVRAYVLEKWDITIDNAVLEVEACAASDEVAEILNIPSKHPLLSLGGVAVDVASNHIYYMNAFINTDLYKFSVLRR